MAGQTTQIYHNTVSGSVVAGMGSLLKPGGKTYYILEHKVSSKYHKAGESQEIIVDNIEIGRDPHCQVRFDAAFNTVSRHHAGIVRDGDNWKLVQISKTNSTLLNGRPVQTEWYLQNGDEIQLSANGPKLGFIIPTGSKATVGSIALTRRLSLFRQQALRPYKYAIAALCLCLVMAIGGLGAWNYSLNSKLQAASQQLAEQVVQAAMNGEAVDSLMDKLIAANDKIASLDGQLAKIRRQKPEIVVREGSQPAASGQNDAKADISSCLPYVYYIKEYISDEAGNPLVDENGSYYCSTGTGFLLNNGYMVTAMHVLCDEPGFQDDGSLDVDSHKTLLNSLYFAGKAYMTVLFVSSTDKFSTTFLYKDSPFKYGTHNVLTDEYTNSKGQTWPAFMFDYTSENDWAVIKANRPSGGLAFDRELSRKMPIKTHLDILGFPDGVGAEDISHVSPIFSESSVAREGLDTDGCVLLSNSETDHGNSGGPVLTEVNGQLVVVGILTGANKLGSKTNSGKVDGKWKDRVVPISNAF